MKRRITCLLLALAMCLTLLPASAGAENFAEQPEPVQLASEQTHENHCVCGGKHKDVGDHGSEEKPEMWTGVADLSEIQADGYYYLTQSVELSTRWTAPDADIVLCLNGYSIISKCTEASYEVIRLMQGRTFTLTNCKETGTVTHAEGAYGPGVWVNNGTFKLYHAAISGNTGSSYGGVYVGANAAFYMYSGKITQNDATSRQGYDGIGGGVYAGGSFYMYGGEITDNQAKTKGGGVFVSAGSNNTAAAVFTVSGDVTITGNTVNNTDNNVYLSYSRIDESTTNYSAITVDGLGQNAAIGVTSESKPTAENPVEIASGAQSGDARRITSDSAAYAVTFENGSLLLADVTTLHYHPVCGQTCSHLKNGKPIHPSVLWTGVSSLDEITDEGNYYLEKNVKYGTRTNSFGSWTEDWWPADGVRLCLHGHDVIGTGSDRSVVIDNDREFTLTDCSDTPGSITHQPGPGSISAYTIEGDGVEVRSGTFNMYGGKIAENRSDSGVDASGVTVSYGAVFNMYGGSITNNWFDNATYLSSIGGVCVYGTFNMYGGEITKNYGKGSGGGVRVSSGGTFTVSGNAKITGNRHRDQSGTSYSWYNSNVVLDDAKIAIGTEGLGPNAEIGVYTTYKPTIYELAIVTNAEESDLSYFFSDESAKGFQIKYKNGELILYTPTDETHEHPVCGKTCGHQEKDTDISFTAWESKDSLPTSGVYYLTEDVTLKQACTLTGDLTLCLNGKRIQLEGTAHIKALGNCFTLTDCEATGEIQHTTGSNPCVWVGQNYDEAGSGSAFIMYQGKLTGGYRGVTVASKEQSAVFTMNGGSIEASKERGVQVYGTKSGFVMNGGQITKNTKWGAVDVADESSFTMNGGSITGNASDGSGGGVTLTGKASFAMTGGSITGNTAKGDGGGVLYNRTTSSMRISGDAEITGNKKVTDDGEEASNVSLYQGCFIDVDNAFSGSVGVNLTVSSSSETITKETYAGIDHFFADNPEYIILRASYGPYYCLSTIRKISVPTVPKKTYNGSAQTCIGENYRMGYTLSGEITATDAGEYTATATLERGYVWSDGTTEPKQIKWEIGRKTPTASDFIVTLPTDLTYDGSAKTVSIKWKVNPDDGLADTDGITIIYYSGNWVKVPNNQAINAGTYRFTFTVGERKNYTAVTESIQDVDNFKFEIVKPAMTGVQAEDYTGAYDGNPHNITVTGAPEGSVIRYAASDDGQNLNNRKWGSESYGVSETGTHTVYYRVYHNNYQTFCGSATVVISGADLTEGADKTLTLRYDDTAEKTLTAADFGFTQAGTLMLRQSVTDEAGLLAAAPAIESGALKFQLKSGLTAEANGKAVVIPLTFRADSANYNAKDVTLRVTISPKKPQALSFAESSVSRTYGDADFALAASHTAGDGEVRYRSSNPAVAVVDEDSGKVKILAAGETTITAQAQETADYAPLEVSYTLTVGKARITITGKSLSAYVGDAAPALSADSYTVSGLVGSDKLEKEPDVRYETDPDMTAAGETAILLSGAQAPAGGNYSDEITYVPGKLTVSKRSNPGWPGYRPGGSSASVKKDAEEEDDSLSFVDVRKGAYYYDAVSWAVKQGVIDGVGGNRFAPDDLCTRAQIVTLLWRAAGSPAPKAPASFTDVSPEAYYAKAVAWAVEAGVATGTGSGRFSPDAPCTRAQAVAFLYRAFGAAAVSGETGFRDVAADAYYAQAVLWAVNKHVAAGVAEGLFAPDQACTRAQIAAFLYRAYTAK